MNHWSFVALWHRFATCQPDRVALAHGQKQITWSQFDRRAAALARGMMAAGLQKGDVVALCLPNHPDYLIAFAASLRAHAIPANVNYRYRRSELQQLLHLLNPTVVVFPDVAANTISTLMGGFPRVKQWVRVGPESSGACGTPLQALIDTPAPTTAPFHDPDAAIIKCTGGTTGQPTAVRWNAHVMFEHLNEHNPWARHCTTAPMTDDAPATADARIVLASPLVHGSALTRALGALCAGGTVITTPGQGFQADAVLDAISDHHADTLAITGDAHAQPLLQEVGAHPHRWSLMNLRTITSSGASWSSANKIALMAALPHVRLIETLGSTEATGLGFSVASHGAVPPTGVFTLGRHATVLRADGSPAEPGEHGLIAVHHPLPTGLHPSGPLPEDRFLSSGSTTFLLSGDHVELLSRTEFAFLGRGEDCINTGGEKVYAPEVAEVLQSHPRVRDAAVFATAHQRLGQAVTALIVGERSADLDDILDYTRRRLAGFKVPHQVHLVDSIPRTPAGKIDLIGARAIAAQFVSGDRHRAMQTSPDR